MCAENTGLRAIDIDSGEEVWQQAGNLSHVSPPRCGRLVFGTLQSRLYDVDLATGAARPLANPKLGSRALRLGLDDDGLGGTQEYRLQIREEVRVQGLVESAVVSRYFKLSARRWAKQI